MVRSIPVSITSNNTAMVVSTVIPSTLSYSSSCSSSVTSANMGTVAVPIQVIKTQKNNNNNKNNNISSTTTPTTSTINKITDSHKGYRYVQKQLHHIKPLTNLTAGNKDQTLPTLSVS